MRHLRNFLVLLTMLTAGAEAVTDSQGQTESGAFYRFMVPDGWEAADGLVIWNHGFSFSPISQNSNLGPLADIQLEQGYAVAASSYSIPGWAVFNTVQDVRQMVTAFGEQFAVPGSIILTGGSLGGIVTAQLLEQGGLDNVVGALSACGVTAGSRVWENALDVRLIYEQVCADVPSASIAGAETGLDFWIPPQALAQDPLDTVVAATIGLQVSSCTGLGLPVELRSDADQARLERILELTGLPDELFFAMVMGYATVVLADLTFDPEKLDGRIGVGNLGVDYLDAELNATIQRVAEDPQAAHWLKHQYLPTGQVGDAKVVAIHTDKDGLVVVENMRDWAELLPAGQISAAVVVEDEPSHCSFSEAELFGAWESLRSWVAGGQQPDATAQQSACMQAIDSGQAQGPCRIDPNYLIQSTEQRHYQRPPPYLIGPEISGSWFNAGRDGEGFLIQILETGRAVVYWFTYPDADSGNLDEEQIWMLGEGGVEGDSIILDSVIKTGGARFGDAFDSADVELMDWGIWRFSFSECDAGVMSYTGPAGFDEGHRSITRLSRLNDNECQPAAKAATIGFSATWYDPARDGEGFLVEELSDGIGVIYWFTYDDQGNQAWMQGVGSIAGRTITFDDVIITGGASFGADFDPEEVQISRFGSITMTLNDDCQTASVEWVTEDPRFQTISNRQELVRLSTPAGVQCVSSS